jgi:hypothetical protein
MAEDSAAVEARVKKDMDDKYKTVIARAGDTIKSQQTKISK